MVVENSTYAVDDTPSAVWTILCTDIPQLQ